MPLSVGIVGLPNAGKSTLFKALSGVDVLIAPYPFSTVDPHRALVHVPDRRVDVLQGMFSSQKKSYAEIEFVDIAGLVRGASKGEGLGNQFLAHIRGVDAIAHVVRCFEDPNVPHPYGCIDPIRDAEIVETELAMADLELAEKRLERVTKRAKAGDGQALFEKGCLEKALSVLGEGHPLRGLEDLTEEERAYLSGLGLLTIKPVLYVANVAEGSIGESLPQTAQRLREYAKKVKAGFVAVCGKLGAEIAELPPDDRREVLQEFGVEVEYLVQLVKEAMGILGLITFLTANENEARAWTLRRGSRAIDAARKVHSDFAKHFVAAEVIPFDELEKAGSWQAAKEKGKIRTEGKNYIVQDGDVILFKAGVK